ncbi:MAG: HAMP domain-containing histidine kinase [Candidatus Eremiobacteraeota bacterium]|nr:HAMP domain-containing histidine kinase [Candidatus Eremiobacteraeota bacterium]
MTGRGSLAVRLASLYATMLAVVVLLVIVASSIALVFELSQFTHDIIVAKHDEARFLAETAQRDGQTLKSAAPRMIRELSGIGLDVAVFDERGKLLAGDASLHPPLLAHMIAQRQRERSHPGPGPGAFPEHREPFGLAVVQGGYVAFVPSMPLVFVALFPYWRTVLTIGVLAILGTFVVGRIFAREALRPLDDVAMALRSLAQGDYTPRTFIMGGGDEIGNLTGAFNDAAANVHQAMEERRATEDRMRRFVADAGHELRTPLTVISGYIDVLRRGALNDEKIARQILGTMTLEKEHMRNLIDRLVRLSRLDSEAAPLAERLDVAQLLRDQVNAARRFDEHRNIDYRVDGELTVFADPREIGEALWNVVENALKYAPDAAIHLRGSREDGSVRIVVRDEGPGMSELERLHSFERFYRGDQRGEITGSGLGLSIAKRAVERAGGSIEIESAPGRGTTVTIELAAAPIPSPGVPQQI